MEFESKKQEEIYKVLSQYGAMGVTALARHLGIKNASGLHQHLNRQKFFKQNENKHWDLPEKVINGGKTNAAQLSAQAGVQAIESYLLAIKAQLEETMLQVNTAIVPIDSLKKEVAKIPAPSEPPVAESAKVHSGLIKLNENINQIPVIIKSKKEMLTDDLFQLLLNVDWMELILDNGRKFFREVIETNLYDVLLGNKDELSEEALSCIKEYQTDKQDKTA